MSKVGGARFVPGGNSEIAGPMITTWDATAIAKGLEAKGVQLGKPASTGDLNSFETETGLSLDGRLRQVYLTVNGFSMAHPKSMIHLWPLERILACRDMAFERDQARYVAIGDFLIDSDMVMSCLSKEAFPVWLLCEKREL